MRLQDCTMAVMLPPWMAEQADDCALASVVDSVARKAYESAQDLTVWNRIEQLPEATLDELAWALDIEWWDSSASLETKRSLIRNSDLVHAKKGTPAAVESVIESYFGSGRLMEWNEYGGEPYHFKCFTINPQLVADNQALFLSLLEKVKRKSAKLDGILISLTGEMDLFSGVALRNHDRFVQSMGTGEMFMIPGTALIQNDHVIVSITAGITNGEE